MDEIISYRCRYAIVAALSLLATVASADEAVESAEIEECSASIALNATVRQIASNPAEYNGGCVSVLGVMRGLDFFEDLIDPIFT